MSLTCKGIADDPLSCLQMIAQYRRNNQNAPVLRPSTIDFMPDPTAKYLGREIISRAIANCSTSQREITDKNLQKLPY